MRQSRISLLLFIFFSCAVVCTLSAEVTNYKYGDVNLRNVDDQGVSYIAVEDLKQILDLNIKYFPFTKILTITKGVVVYKFVIDTRTVFINGEMSEINAPPKVIDGELFLPLGFLKDQWLKNAPAVTSTVDSAEPRIDEQLSELSFQNTDLKNQEKGTSVPENRSRSITVILDAGHGGKDPGTVFEKILEKNITLSIAKKLKEYFDTESRFRAILVRTNDKFIELDERTFFANSNHGDLLLSIHVNAAYSDKANGIDLFVPGRNEKDVGNIANKEINKVTSDRESLETGLLNLKQDIIFLESKKIGLSLKDSLDHDELGIRFRAIKKSRFCIFSNIDMPSLLIEFGFITNSGDREYLLKEPSIDLIAKRIFYGVKNYYDRQ